MKARNHQFVALLVAAAISWFIATSSNNSVAVFLDTLGDKEFIWIFFGMYLYVAGSLLPDADSEDRGSGIFHYLLIVPVGYIAHILEHPIAALLDRPRGHRESLHTVVGITIVSLVISIITSMIIIFVFGANGTGIQLINGWLFLFGALFVSQIVHVVCDFHFRLK